jgi:membrane protein YqaA with SNARE-associated domain
MTRPTGWALVPLVWAIAEATVWPIMPDAVMVPLALRRPRSWWQLVLGGVVGTAFGGWLSYLDGRRRPGRDRTERLWLVRPAMVTAADRWLAKGGPRGVLRQPATGIPFKVFARVAGARGLAVVPFLVWAVAGRAARFTLLAGVAALVGCWRPTLATHWYWPTTGGWLLLFCLALWRLVTYWERHHH